MIEYLTVFLTIIAMDALWLSMNYNYHKNLFGKVQGSPLKVRLIPALLVYILIAVAVVYFAVDKSKSIKEAAMNGAFIGASMYGLYDLTNLGTLKGWTYEMAIKDTLWGTTVCAVSAAVAKKFS